MALFKKKPTNDDDGDASFEPQPEKARKWFDHAKTSADSANHEYALECYAAGIKLDPTVMSAHERMFESALRYMNNGGKPASSRQVRGLDDGTAVAKFAAAEFEWMKDLKNLKSAIKALDAAVKAELPEFGNWIAPKVLGLLRAQKKVSKTVLLQVMDLVRQVGAWDESLAVGEMARQLDPTDADLDAELKNLSAQRAMDQGGYDQTAGQEGGFRQYIKDSDRQKELIEEESLAGGASIEERNLQRAKDAYEETPKVPDVVNRYAQLVKKQGTPEAEETAHRIYMKGFDDTGEYRFRMRAGDIRIEQLERTLRELDAKLADGADDALATERDEVRRKSLDLKIAEYTERVAKYPTDRFRRFELGATQFDLGRFEDAMEQLQGAKDEPKLRVRASHLLGRCFFAEQWFAEAIAEFRDALDAMEGADRDVELAVQYDLMLAMLASADQEASLEQAREAKSICSDIARKNITYRDIRAQRREVDALIKRLSDDSAG